MSKKSDGKKNVVVVGGGFVGNIIVRSLSAKLHPSKCNLILVNARPYSIHMLAGARIITSDEGRLEDTAFMPYDKIFVNGNGSLRAGKVTAIDTNNTSRGGFLTLQDGGKRKVTILYSPVVELLALNQQASSKIDVFTLPF